MPKHHLGMAAMATAKILALGDIRTICARLVVPICARLVVLNNVLYTEQISYEIVMDGS